MSYCESPTAIRIWVGGGENEWFVDGVDEALYEKTEDYYTEWCGSFDSFDEAVTVGVAGACKMMGVPYIKADIDRLLADTAFVDDMLIISFERQVAI